MDAKTLTAIAGQNDSFFRDNLKGLTNADGLLQVANGGNTLNWVAGHVVYWRDQMLRMAGGEGVWTEDEGAPYRGAAGNPNGAPPFDVSKAKPLGDIASAMHESSKRFAERLGALTAEALATSPDGNGTVGQMLTFLLGHETYHVGQLGVYRRMANKVGAK